MLGGFFAALRSAGARGDVLWELVAPPATANRKPHRIGGLGGLPRRINWFEVIPGSSSHRLRGNITT